MDFYHMTFQGKASSWFVKLEMSAHIWSGEGMVISDGLDRGEKKKNENTSKRVLLSFSPQGPEIKKASSKETKEVVLHRF